MITDNSDWNSCQGSERAAMLLYIYISYLLLDLPIFSLIALI